MERNRELATQIDYFNHISTEGNVTASFTYVCGKKMVERVKRPVGRSRMRPLKLSEPQADKEKVQTLLTQETANERTQ